MTSTDRAPVAVVTGASSGIGAATARALAAGGYRVAEQLCSQVEVTAQDVAAVIAFAVRRARRLAIHEVLPRPAGQEL